MVKMGIYLTVHFVAQNVYPAGIKDLNELHKPELLCDCKEPAQKASTLDKAAKKPPESGQPKDEEKCSNCEEAVEIIYRCKRPKSES